MAQCLEIVAAWEPSTERWVCRAERYTTHSHQDGLALGYLHGIPKGAHISEVDKYGCSFLLCEGDGTLPCEQCESEGSRTS